MLAGRGAEMAAARQRLDAVASGGKFAPGLFFLAPRGLGKTALLEEIGSFAAERNFVVAAATAGTGQELVDVITSAIRRELSKAPQELRQRVAEVLARLSVTLSVPGVQLGVSAPPGGQDQGLLTFAAALHELSTAVREAGYAGVAIIVDEIQQATKESLSQLLPALQELGGRAFNSPVAFFAAGVVSTPRTLAAVYGFAERFEYRMLERLDDVSAAIAFHANSDSDVEWLPGSLEAAIAVAAGHPFIIQSIGHYAWEESGATHSLKPGIVRADIEVASELAARDLQRIFSARWEDRTDAEREVLGQVARYPDGVSRSVLARAIALPRDAVDKAVRELYDDGWLDVRGLEHVVYAYEGIRAVVTGRLGSPGGTTTPGQFPSAGDSS